MGPKLEMVGSSWSVRASGVFLLAPRCSSCLPSIFGIEEDDAREGSWSLCGEALALLGC
jgi:hypothetical protein